MPTLPGTQAGTPKPKPRANKAAEILASPEGREMVWRVAQANPGMSLDQAIRQVLAASSAKG